MEFKQDFGIVEEETKNTNRKKKNKQEVDLYKGFQEEDSDNE